MTPHPFEDDAAITAALGPLVAGGARATLVRRRPNACFSSSPTEIVSLASPDGAVHELFLKYERPVVDPEPRCRQALAYCGLVHERIVDRLPLPAVRALGIVAGGSPPVTVLVMEYLADCLRVNETHDDSGIVAAAAWCGRMHAWGRWAMADEALGFLVRYDLDYYRAWSARARRLATETGDAPDWLGGACAAFDDLAGVLVAAEQTTIHGEFGPQNVLWRGGVVHPVDWESAAIGPGEIDLATLLFGWPADTVGRGIEAYWLARGTSAPRTFPTTYAAATVYTALRWLPEPGADGWQAGLARLQRVAAQTRTVS